MKRIILSIFSFLVFSAYSQDCPMLKKQVIYNDTSANVMKLMGDAFTSKSSCNSHIVLFTDKNGSNSPVSIQPVYAISFYYKSEQNTKLTMSLGTNDSLEILLQPSKGMYYTFPISGCTYISKLKQMKLTVSGNAMVDEIGFLYTEEKPLAMNYFELETVMKKEKRNFEKKKRKEHSKRWYQDRGNIRRD